MTAHLAGRNRKPAERRRSDPHRWYFERPSWAVALKRLADEGVLESGPSIQEQRHASVPELAGLRVGEDARGRVVDVRQRVYRPAAL